MVNIDRHIKSILNGGKVKFDSNNPNSVLIEKFVSIDKNTLITQLIKYLKICEKNRIKIHDSSREIL